MVSDWHSLAPVGRVFMAGEKLRRYGIAAASLFLTACVVSLIQHLEYITGGVFAFLYGIATRILPVCLVIVLLMTLYRFFFGGKR